MKTVWVNGCFDILHPGHVELFKVAKSLGDRLIVGIDTDEKVKNDKGNSRPINPLYFRKSMLESIKYIDVVLSFGSKSELEDLIELYSPDILMVGSDWKNGEVVGRQFAKEVRFFNRIGNYSSTKIIEKIHEVCC
jgi:D-beta-D-heptose 7-phosphate kinase/D-beta-D-heptose 1-phosphate adenosyltransferase